MVLRRPGARQAAAQPEAGAVVHQQVPAHRGVERRLTAQQPSCDTIRRQRLHSGGLAPTSYAAPDFPSVWRPTF